MAGRGLLGLLGVLMIAAGLLFAAQGSGLLPYPAQSFMVDRTPWVWAGLGLAVAGALVLGASRRGR